MCRRPLIWKYGLFAKTDNWWNNGWNRKNVLKKNIERKQKSSNLGAKMPYLGNFDSEFEKTIVMFEVSTFKLSYCKLSCKNGNPKMWDQKCHIWLFFGKNSKHCFHIWNQYSQICIIAKFVEKIKILEFGTVNALFGYFRAGIWKAPLNFSKCKISWKSKNV